jgi:hypothetical protein
MSMQKTPCQCPGCRTSGAAPFEILEFAIAQEGELVHDEEEASVGARDGEGPFGEVEESELALELLGVSSEAELDQFLGKLFRRAAKGLKKVGSSLGKAAGPLGGVLKGVAKKALPFVGGALGSLIPIPGVGTAVGTALGSAVSQALEAELSGLETEDQELQMARRFVRIAGTAAQQAARSAASHDPQTAARSAVLAAARQHLPRLGHTSHSGRWERRGDQIVLFGV